MTKQCKYKKKIQCNNDECCGQIVLNTMYYGDKTNPLSIYNLQHLRLENAKEDLKFKLSEMKDFIPVGDITFDGTYVTQAIICKYHRKSRRR